MNLNLPAADIRLEKRRGQLYLWDYLRTRWIRVTPEEWVRQHFTLWMISELGYPRGRMAHEVSLQVGGRKRRCDAVFYDQHGQPQIIMEFKAPDVAISQSACDQIIHYNQALQDRWEQCRVPVRRPAVRGLNLPAIWKISVNLIAPITTPRLRVMGFRPPKHQQYIGPEYQENFGNRPIHFMQQAQ